MPRRTVISASLAVALWLTAVGSAHATYPGATNGRLAFGMTVDGNTDVYTARPDGHGLRRLTDDPGFDACAAFSADGRWLAWCGPGGVWVMRANGTRKRQVTTFGGFPDISPDGTRVAFMGVGPGSSGLGVYVAGVAGGEARLVADGPGLDGYPVWSPDGSTIAFLSDRSGIAQVWLVDADGGDPRQLTFDPRPKDQVPDWRPDGAALAYVARTGSADGGDVWVVDADGGDPRPLTSGRALVGTAWSPDGTRIATLDVPTRTVQVLDVCAGAVVSAMPAIGPQFVPGWQPLGRRAAAAGR